MNSLVKFHDTPKGRVKMTAIVTDAKVSPGASGSGSAVRPFKYTEMSLHITNEDNARYVLRMDRETAQRVIDTLTKYLAEAN